MIVCPPSLIKQHIKEILEKTDALNILLYYSDYRVGEELGPRVRKINRRLTKGHEVFNGDPDNDRNVIITTKGTLAVRHSTSALTDWRVERGWTRARAEAACLIPDQEWEGDISGQVNICAVDECHDIKSKESKAATTIRSLDARFYALISATPINNRIDDSQGYLPLIEPKNVEHLWSNANLATWNVDEHVNPYNLHPAVVLRATGRAANKFIFSKDVEDAVKGIRLEKLWEVCMICRRYDSPVPGDPARKIAAHIPNVARKTMVLSFTDEEWKIYTDLSSIPLKKLIKPLDDGTGRVVWNMRYFRDLLMLSTWFGFKYVGPHVKHDTNRKWRRKDNIIHAWITKVHMAEPSFPLPDRGNVVEQLAVMCRGSPKIRMFLHAIADKVILKQRRVVIWCLIPAHQLLVFGLFSLLQIRVGLYTSDLTFEERNEVVTAFQQPGPTMAFIASLKMTSAGLNLHQQCFEEIFFDNPTSKQMRDQAEGRARRLGQLFVVICLYLRVPGTFFDRITANNLLKFLPTMVAELDHTVFDKGLTENDDGEIIAHLGNWVKVEGNLMLANDPRAAHVQPEAQLSVEEILSLLLRADAGEVINMDLD